MAGVNERMQKLVARMIHRWEAVQVELHGHYSIERFTALSEYSRSTGFWRALVILPLTPLPSLIVVALIDAMPLESIDKGVAHSGTSWVRATLTCFIYTHCAIEQIRLYSPSLKLQPVAALSISIPAALLTNLLAFGLSVFVCYPLPFVTVMMSFPWLGFTTFFLLRVCGAHMRANPEAVKDVVRFATVGGAQITIVLIYAVFNTIFTNLSPTYQPLFALLIPVFKVVQKNVLSRLLSGRDDTKPQVVILNVEIFNALFISTCMQNAQSIGTSITLIVVDLLVAAISLVDLYRMVNDVKKVMDKLKLGSNALIMTAERVLESYPATANRRFTSSRQRSNAWTGGSPPRVATISLKKKKVLPTMRMEAGEYEIPIPISQSTSVGDVSTLSLARLGSNDAPAELPSASPTIGLSLLTNREHYLLLKKALQVLFFTEFMILVEFTEVLVPVIYGTSWIGY
ncbi:hypothetical protein PR003_g11993 [Phytophthora rubi]|uniref:Uncharacterized protein n=1 Tax=Phytophthora rubi TaxID=129364 RepID=A0A6A4F9A9_9STRA|nr:hypothetical protein PR001_g11276 [Phytophthora rubi]KAE9337456.1 hypothetical protein PR003_g11993 [Phytophthora rubi]